MSAAAVLTPPPVVTSPPVPAAGPVTYGGAWAYRVSVAQYDTMVAAGVLGRDDKVELLEGYLVLKTSRNPLRDGTMLRVNKRLLRTLPGGWDIRVQMAVQLADSRPEPDLAVVREDAADYATHHPAPHEIGMVVEVADSSLERDLRDKTRVYAAAGIPAYWVVDVPDRQIEVFTDPISAATPPAYRTRTVYAAGDAVPLVLGGAAVTALAVADLLP